jgi:PAS domain S-box-containing protein
VLSPPDARRQLHEPVVALRSSDAGLNVLVPFPDGRSSALYDFPAARMDAPTLDSPTYREFLESLGVAVYTTDADGRITFYNEAATRFWGRRPKIGEEWCGSLRLFWPDGTPLPHDGCPMAIALRERRSVRGYEAIAERPDGSRVWFIPYPTVIEDASGRLLGAVNVLIDITDRKVVEQAAQAAKAVKDEFLGLVSHELRTPVTTIFGNSRLLTGRGGLGDREAMLVADIAVDAERLLSVVENLLTLTRLDTQGMIDSEPQIVAEVLSSVVASFERRHPTRVIQRELDERRLIVEADRAHLELLVGNIISNAHKYSPPGEPIEIVLREVDREAQVVVLDRGIGLESEDLDGLFSTFFRADNARKTSSGLGIGLSACKRVVELLGGRIWARPREGRGAEFGFALPLLDQTAD